MLPSIVTLMVNVHIQIQRRLEEGMEGVAKEVGYGGWSSC